MKMLNFACLISPSKIICLRSNIKHSTQCFITRRNTLTLVKKYSAARLIFNSPLSVSSGDETVRLMLDALQSHTLSFI